MGKLKTLNAAILSIGLVFSAAAAHAESGRNFLPGVFKAFNKKSEQTAALSEETRKNDEIIANAKGKKFKVPSKYEPTIVPYGGYKAGTIVIDTNSKYLYLVEGWGKARRYAVAVGRDGLEFKGKAKIYEKQEWPRWIPTKDMIKRQPGKYAKYKDGMDGGPDNPLGARALYLYQGKVDTHIRIHGTNQPSTVGSASSNGCFRMINEHVMDLYGRVKVGAEVVVL